jgi:hypothetical protein
VLLKEIHPASLDLGHLVFCDHALLYSGELGGPTSLHPKLPISPGELGMKRKLIEDGLNVLARAGLTEVHLSADGISYSASEDAAGFVNILTSPYLKLLVERAHWVGSEIANNDIETLRARMNQIFTMWADEFFAFDDSLNTERLGR